MKAREEEDTVAGQQLVCLYQSNLDVNTAAVKELMHGPYTSWQCEMNFDLTMSLFLVRNPSLAQVLIVSYSMSLKVCEAIIYVCCASFSSHT